MDYPTQNEAEAMADWFNAISTIYTGDAPRMREAFIKADEIRMKLHREIFGERSPWSVKIKKNKVVIFWDNYKAKNLGL